MPLVCAPTRAFVHVHAAVYRRNAICVIANGGGAPSWLSEPAHRHRPEEP
jgi:hypothetical protein